MNRRTFLKAGALFVPAAGMGQGFTLRDQPFVAKASSLPGGTQGGGGGGFSYTAATLNGTNQYFNRGANFTGIADSKTGIFSCWIKFSAASDGAFDPIFYGDGSHRIYKNSDLFQIAPYSSAVAFSSSGTWTSADGWIHLIVAWDTSDASKCKGYINGNNVITLDFRVNINVDWTAVSDWGIGNLPGGGFATACCISEFYFAPGQWLDLTDSANRLKFRTSGGKPADVGSDGSTPTGTAPILYMNVYNGTNAGTGGNLTLHNGALSSCTAP